VLRVLLERSTRFTSTFGGAILARSYGLCRHTTRRYAGSALRTPQVNANALDGATRRGMNSPPEVFETERLHVRRLRSPDASLVFENWAQSTEVTRFLVWRPHESVDESVAHAQRCEAAWDDGSSYTWIIDDRNTGAPLGSIAAHPAGHRVGLGYLLAPGAWGRGLMVEAVTWLTKWFLEQPNIYRVWAVCDVANSASARVLEKSGFTCEGILRRWIVHPNISAVPRDVLSFSVVRE